jgi:plastocyanin
MRIVRTLTPLAAVAAATIWGTGPALAGGGCHAPSTEGTGATVELSQLCMSPTVLRTDVGATVTFVNRDAVEHNVYGKDFFGDLPRSGDMVQQRFESAGVYVYQCTIHPGMAGAVVVGDGRGSGPVTEVKAAFPAPVDAAGTLIGTNHTSSSDRGIPTAAGVAGAAAFALVGAVVGCRTGKRGAG